MLKLNLHARLVVLSGCDTGGGTLYPGEGVVGMAWALLSAGCPTTVVSLWKADSRSTSRLMIELHRRLAAGDTPAVALRRAKLTLRHDAWYRHPFYWAPFTVVGDGMTPVVEAAAAPRHH
jgi:CHAT domain-containing protein